MNPAACAFSLLPLSSYQGIWEGLHPAGGKARRMPPCRSPSRYPPHGVRPDDPTNSPMTAEHSARPPACIIPASTIRPLRFRSAHGSIALNSSNSGVGTHVQSDSWILDRGRIAALFGDFKQGFRRSMSLRAAHSRRKSHRFRHCHLSPGVFWRLYLTVPTKLRHIVWRVSRY